MFLNRRDKACGAKPGIAIVSAATALVLTAGCGGSTSNFSTSANYGTSVVVSGGTAKAYVVTDNANNPTAIGVEVSLHALDNPAHVTVYPDAAPFNLTFPSTTPQLPFRSVTFFTTSGHGPDFGGEPGPYEVPHYHVAFSLYTIQQRTAIGTNLWGISSTYPDASTYLDADKNFNTPDVYYPNPLQPTDNPYKIYVPQSQVDADHPYYTNYSDSPFTPLVPGSTTQRMGQELPSLGTVLYDPEVPEFNGGTFTHESDWQFFAGSLSAITITAPRSELVTADNPGTSVVKTPTNINVTVPLGKPQAFQNSGYYPTTYSIRYNASSNTYDFELGGLKFHQGVDTNGNPQVAKS